MKSFIICFFLLICIIPRLAAQTECGHSLYLKQAEADSLFKSTHDALEKSAVEHFTFRKKNTMPGGESGGAAGTIPVVVHTLHDDGAENIAEAQVQQALAWLNAAFAHVAPYAQGSGVNTGIHFCLATRDPEGRATSGIVRVKTPLTVLSLAQEEAAKASSYWPSDQYLNIWVVRDICWESLGCGVAAYASVPSFHGRKNDGIVIEHTFFGTTPGRTAALIHEAGHYLGLYHTFEGGCTNSDCLVDGDRVCDTPPDQSTAWLPCDQTVNTCTTDAQSGFSTDMPDATRNFMDYGNLECFQEFSAGQGTRMRFFLEGARKSLLDSKGCNQPCPYIATTSILPGDTLVAAGTTLNFQGPMAPQAQWNWTVNGQAAGQTASLDYTFTETGNQVVVLTLQVATPDICAPQRFERRVEVFCPAVSNFTAWPIQVNVNQPVRLTQLSTGYSSLEWLIDGILAGSNLSQQVFATPGKHNITLNVYNGVCSSSKTVVINVQCYAVADFIHWPLDLRVGDTLHLTLLSSNYTFLQWSVNGNPYPDTLQHITFTESGPYTIRLIAGNQECQSEKKVNIWVNDSCENQVFSKIFMTEAKDARGRCSIELYDGSLWIGGDGLMPDKGREMIFIKTDQSGAVLKSFFLGTSGDETLKQLAPVRTGGFVALGSVITAGIEQMIVVRFDTDGNVLWQNQTDLPQGVIARKVLETSFSGEFVVLGQVLPDANKKSSILMASIHPVTGLEWCYRYSADHDIFPMTLNNNALVPLIFNKFRIYGGISESNGSGKSIFSADFTSEGVFDTAFTSVLQNRPDTDLCITADINLNNATGYIKNRNTGQTSDLYISMFTENATYTIYPDTLDIYPVDATTNTIIFNTSINGKKAGGYRVGSFNQSFLYAYQEENELYDVESNGNLAYVTGYNGNTPESRHIFWSRIKVQSQVEMCNGKTIYWGSSGVRTIRSPLQLSTESLSCWAASNAIKYTNQAVSRTLCNGKGLCNNVGCSNNVSLVNYSSSVYSNVLPAKDNLYYYIQSAPGFSITHLDFEGTAKKTTDISFLGDYIEDVLLDNEGCIVGVGNGEFDGADFVCWFRYNPQLDSLLWFQYTLSSGRGYKVEEIEPNGNYRCLLWIPEGNATRSIILEISRKTGQLVTNGLNCKIPEALNGKIYKTLERQNEIWLVGGHEDNAIVGALSKTGQWKWLYKIPKPDIQTAFTAKECYPDKDSVWVIIDQYNATEKENYFLLAKFDSRGQLLGTKKYRLQSNFYPFEVGRKNASYKIESIPDGLLIYIFYSDSYLQHGLRRCHLMRLDRHGNILWANYLSNTWNINGNYGSGQRPLFYRNERIFLSVSDYLANIDAKTGLISGTCEIMLPLSYKITNITPAPEAWPLPDPPSLTLTSLTWPYKISNSPKFFRYAPCTYTCKENCTNFEDDNGDHLADCDDPQCACSPCKSYVSSRWYFGKNAGLDFNGHSPTVLEDGETDLPGVNAIQASAFGSWIFYQSNRNFIVNSGNQPNSLKGNGNNAISFTMLHKTYALITTEDNNVYYTRVNENSFDGSQVNRQLNNSLSNKFSAFTVCNRRTWLVMKNADGNGWQRRLFTGTSRGSIITAAIGTAGKTGDHTAGQLKFNRTGDLLVNTLPATGGIEFFDFDLNAGVLSNPRAIILPELQDAFGLEFSPDNRFLYVSTYGRISQVWQFDLQAGKTIADIAASRVLLVKNLRFKNYGCLQLAPNGKIYVAMNPDGAGSDALSVIHEPDKKGTAARFEERGQYLGAGRCFYGLPAFVQSDLDLLPPLNIRPVDTVCGNSVMLGATGKACNQDLRWTIIRPDNTFYVSDVFVQTITVNFGNSDGGEWTAIVNARATNILPDSCLSKGDTMRFFVVRPPRLSLGPDRTLCATGVTVLRATPGFVRYRWGNGTADSTLTTFTPGKYTLEAWDQCGTSQRDTVEIKVEPNTKPNLGPDRSVCREKGIEVQRPANFTAWEWSPKTAVSGCDTCRTVLLKPQKATDFYVVTRTAAGCLGTDTLRLTPDTLRSRRTLNVCPNARLPFLGATLPPDTTAFFGLTTTGGCDSILEVSTLALDTTLRRMVRRACPGDSVQIANVWIRAGQTKPVVLTGRNGCDSTLLVRVDALPEIRITMPRDTSLKIGDTLALRTRASGGTGALTYEWSSPEQLSCTTCLSPQFRGIQADSFTYTFRAKDANGCFGTGTVTIAVNDSCLVYYPNVFTPDGDGVNDRFYLLTFPCVERIVSFTIYSRWGDVVFSGSDLPANDPASGWDGNDPNGKPFPMDVLFWKAKVRYYNGKEGSAKGELTLLR